LTAEEMENLSDRRSKYKNLKLYGWEKGLEKDEIEVITKHLILEISLVTIAKEENISKNTLKSRYRRALAKVKKNLEGDK
ncbi:MAG: hypothetical protein K2J93_05845, partial [Anaeroplasmataceae bacterium]|nr:hypothetical protein [Anaeroplasmataceae bacterium]